MKGNLVYSYIHHILSEFVIIYFSVVTAPPQITLYSVQSIQIGLPNKFLPLREAAFSHASVFQNST